MCYKIGNFEFEDRIAGPRDKWLKLCDVRSAEHKIRALSIRDWRMKAIRFVVGANVSPVKKDLRRMRRPN